MVLLTVAGIVVIGLGGGHTAIRKGGSTSAGAARITSGGTATTDIEYIVALAAAHDSGIADDRRRDIASDLDNLTIADPTVNSRKGARDAAEWMPIPRRMVRGTRDPGKAGIRVDRRSG